MDGSILEHSDSDSGESWTLLENTPLLADEAPEFKGEDGTDNLDKDEDTDGISIISDSEPETTTPSDLGYDKCLLEESCPTEQQIPNYVSINPLPSNNNDDYESIRNDDDFLGDNKLKLKTYVHRRNKRLSTMLNIIVLGSVITAAGVAIGHMWGARNECMMHTTPSVNKILSNLYKLQEENAYLRSKLKELTFVNNIQMQQRKSESDKAPFKQHRCKKVFEESLSNRNADKSTKCLDKESNSVKLLESHMVDQEYEKEFLNDIDKLRNVYQQNKSWLDEEIARRMKKEDEVIKMNNKSKLKSPKSIRVNEEHKPLKDLKLKKQLDVVNETPVNVETVINVTEPVRQPVLLVINDSAKEASSEKKITYADSLRSEHLIKKTENNKINTENNIKEYMGKKKTQKEFDTISENSVSDDEIKKDDRYIAQKFKPERKKNDRHKIYKKQKRRNKYEQWEMKGGYMKDYDDFSITSSQENDYTLKHPDKNFPSQDFERKNYINQFSDPKENIKSADTPSAVLKPKPHNRPSKKSNGKKDKDNWYEKRAALRTEARKKLEQELFGESTPNNAGWYFRRMQRREQCRVKGDNSTYRKLSKRIMNFKTKH